MDRVDKFFFVVAIVGVALSPVSPAFHYISAFALGWLILPVFRGAA